MRLAPVLIAAAATAALCACSREEEEPIADQYDRQKAEIENQAINYELQVANDVAAAEARLESEADLILNRANVNAAEANAAEAAAPARQPPP